MLPGNIGTGATMVANVKKTKNATKIGESLISRHLNRATHVAFFPSSCHRIWILNPHIYYIVIFNKRFRLLVQQNYTCALSASRLFEMRARARSIRHCFYVLASWRLLYWISPREGLATSETISCFAASIWNFIVIIRLMTRSSNVGG